MNVTPMETEERIVCCLQNEMLHLGFIRFIFSTNVLMDSCFHTMQWS